MRRIRTLLASLPVRLLACVIVPLVGFTTLAAMLVLRALEGRFEERMQEEVQMVARALQRPVSRALERNQTGSIRAALRSAFDIHRVYGAYVYDSDGAVLAAFGETDERVPPDEAFDSERSRGRGGYGRIGSERVYSYYVPVWLDAEGASGLLEITRRKSDIDGFIRRLRWTTFLLMGLACSVMTAIVIVGYHAAVGATLRRFQHSMERVQNGEMQHRAAPGGPRELSLIVTAFNAMLDSIQATERKLRIETEKRIDLRLRLLASEKLAGIGRVAAGIAHELGTPLGTVSGRVQRLLRSRSLDPRQADELRRVSQEVRRMDRIVREVLDFGREEPGRRRRISAAVLASMASMAVREEAVARGVRIELRGDDDGPAVAADPARIERALVNLLRNALQASPEGGAVRLSWKGDGDSVVFAVEDEGAGIAAEAAPHLFEPFFSTRGEEGTGLGLAVVDAVARQHGGAVSAGNRREGGARFLLRLPLGGAAGSSPELVTGYAGA